MRAECVKEKLRNAITHAERVTGKNLSLPILSSLLIEAKEKSLLVRATNLDIGVEFQVPAKVLEQGKVAVVGSLLNNFLSLVTDSDVLKLALAEGNVTVTTRTTSSVIKCFPADDFPTIPHLSESNSMLLEASRFVAGLRSVVYAASLSDMKPEIASVHIYEQDGELIFVATDSFRLAEKRIEFKDKDRKGEALSVIIPFKNVLEMIRMFEAATDTLFLQYSKNQISCTSEAAGIYFTSRLVSGVFPHYQQIISLEKKTEVTVSKKELVNALKLASVFADKFNQVTFHIVPSDGVCEIRAHNADTGENTTRVDATVEGEELTASFNNKYILDCFSSIEEDTLSLSYNGAGRPMVIRGMGEPSFLYLVMPLNR